MGLFIHDSPHAHPAIKLSTFYFSSFTGKYLGIYPILTRGILVSSIDLFHYVLDPL
ncbi:hypothetical protein BJX63DRAFT_110232 [Aspergillus granulosus]|uniref:Cytochrome b n=1 Tax=Aspergillus granulosus TaxID=176169 RepID=A0ABR4HPE0_9EURO